MMLCKADFEDLFPDLFPPEAAPTAQEERVDEQIGQPEHPIEYAIKYGWPGLMMAGAVAANASVAAANQAIRNAPRGHEIA